MKEGLTYGESYLTSFVEHLRVQQKTKRNIVEIRLSLFWMLGAFLHSDVDVTGISKTHLSENVGKDIVVCNKNT